MRRGRILLIIGVVLLLATAAVGFLMWRRMSQGEPTPPPVSGEEGAVPYAPAEGTEVIVAAQDIPRGTLITEQGGAVMATTWPQDSAVTEVALKQASGAYGRIARVDIVRGSPILPKMLAEDAGEMGAAGSDAALSIPAGRVAYALPVARYSAVAWALRPGDRVDVMISLLMVDLDEEFQTLLPNQAACVSPPEGEECQSGTLGRLQTLPNGWIVNVRPQGQQRPRLVTQLTIQDAKVLRVGDWDPEPEATPPPEGGEEAAPTPIPEVKPLTLAISPQDAVALKYAQEIGASIDLVLRSPGDANKMVETESVTLEYLFERFNIEQPPKLPYGVTPPLNALDAGSVNTEGSAPGGEQLE